MYESYFTPEQKKKGLSHYNVEVSWGGMWVTLEDDVRFSMHAESFGATQRNHRQLKATSPVVAGDVLVHSVPDMVQENIKVIIKGVDQVELAENVMALEELFDQFAFNLRITKDMMRETMKCQQVAQMTIEGGQVYAHNLMAVATMQVARYPNVSRERL